MGRAARLWAHWRHWAGDMWPKVGAVLGITTVLWFCANEDASLFHTVAALTLGILVLVQSVAGETLRRFGRKLLAYALCMSMVCSGSVSSAIAQGVQDKQLDDLMEQVLDNRMGSKYAVAFDGNGADVDDSGAYIGAMDTVRFGEELAEEELDDEGNVVQEAQAPDPEKYVVTLPANTFVREGYRFVGWSTTATGEDVEIKETVPATYDEDGNVLEGEHEEVVNTIRAQEVPDGTTLDRFQFSYDVNQDGVVTDSEHADVFGNLDTANVLTLYAQWELEEDEEQGSIEDVSGAVDTAGEDGTVSNQLLDDAVDDKEEEKKEGDETAAAQPVSDVFDTSGEEVDASNMGSVDTVLTDAPLVDAEELLAVIDDANGEGEDNEDGLLWEADGTRIETVTVEWISRDTPSDDGDDPRLTQTYTSTATQAVRMRANMSLSGQVGYEVGQVAIYVPKTVVRDRDGNAMGTMTLAVPETPDSRATFAYTELDDCYVLVNTKRLSAASSLMFEFTVTGIKPAKLYGNLVGGTLSEPNERDLERAISDAFWARVELTTHAGTDLSRTSNEIDAQFDTYRRIANAYDRVEGLYTSWPASWPSSLKPTDQDENDASGDYIYVDYYSYVATNGNQPYSMTVTHSADTAGADASKFWATPLALGAKVDTAVTPADDDLSATVDLGDGFETSSGATGHYVHFYVAYPKSEVPQDGSDMWMRDVVTYTLTSMDDGQVTSASATCQRSYSEVPFVFPTGHFITHKWGVGPSGYIQPYSEKPVSPYISKSRSTDVYGGALNLLRDGSDRSVRYCVESVGFGAPWTWVDSNSDAKEQAVELGQLSYTMDTYDSDLTFGYGHQGISGDDYEFSSVAVGTPEVYEYVLFEADGTGYKETTGSLSGGEVTKGTIKAGNWGYKRTYSADVTVELYGTVDGSGEEVRFATIAWMGSSRTVTCENGASTDGTYKSALSVKLPSGVTAWHTKATTTSGAIIYEAWPQVTLRASSDLISDEVASLFENSDSPDTIASDTAEMHVTTEDGQLQDAFINDDSGWVTLTGAALAVSAAKSVGSVRNDTAHQQVSLTYTLSATAQSNVGRLQDYELMVQEGVLTTEESGTFYDLLPLGVEPDLTSVKAVRSGDTVRSVSVERDWRGSGRTLVKIEMDLTPSPYSGWTGGVTGYADTPEVTFGATYSWESLATLGKSLVNVCAYQSANDQFGTIPGKSGEPDDPLAGNHTESASAVSGAASLMTDLDPDSDESSFVYARASNIVTADTMAETGLKKRVSVNDDAQWGVGLADEEMNVYEGGTYSYRLSQTNGSSSVTKHVVFYDAIESYVPMEGVAEGGADDDLGDARWTGTLESVDVSLLEAVGVVPVVYWSDTVGAEVNREAEGAASRDLADTDLWHDWSLEPPVDLSKVTAVAVDCTWAQDGSEFTLGAGETLTAYVRMRAPSDVPDSWIDSTLDDWTDEGSDLEADGDGLVGGAHAYNDVCRTMLVVSEAGTASQREQFDWYHYTKVGLKAREVEVSKRWSDGDDRDRIRPDSVTVELLADGGPTGKTVELSEGNGWKASFGKVLKQDESGHDIVYSVSEQVPDGYTASVSSSTSGDVLSFQVTNAHDPARVSVSGEKVWANDTEATRPSSVSLVLYKDGQRHMTKTLSAQEGDSWSWSWDNLFKYEDGVEIQWTVQEEGYTAGYAPSVEPLGDNRWTVTNTYDPYTDIQLAKTVSKATEASEGTEFAFTFDLVRADGEPDGGEYAWQRSDGATGTVVPGGTVAVHGGETLTVRDVPSESAYTFTEQVPSGWEVGATSGLTGTLRARQTAHASVENVYAATGTAHITATKTLSGRTLAARQFSFALADAGTGETLRQVSCQADGTASFGTLRYTIDDLGEHRYTVFEVDGGKPGYTYDGHVEEVVVTVTDNGDGTLGCSVAYDEDGCAFENVYEAQGSIRLKAWKTLTGRDLADGEFAFDAYMRETDEETGEAVDWPLYLDEDGRPVWGVTERDDGALVDAEGNTVEGIERLKAANDADGLIEFPDVTFDQTHVGQAFQVVVKEADTGDETVDYDGKDVAYTVKVFDNGDGALSFDASADVEPVFENACKDGYLTVQKNVAAEDVDPDAEFTFHVQLTAPEGVELDDSDWSYQKNQTLTGAAQLSLVAETGDGLTASVSFDGSPEGSTLLTIGAGRLSYEWHCVVTDGEGNESDQVLQSLDDAMTFAKLKGVDSYEVYALVSDATGTLVDTVETNRVTVTYRDFAVLTEEGTLMLAHRMMLPEVGDMFEGETVAYVYEDINDHSYVNPWYNEREAILRVDVVDTGVTPDANGMYDWFANCTNLESCDLNGLDTSNVISLSSLFYRCTSIKSIDLSCLDTSAVTNCSEAFYHCEALTTLNVSGFGSGSLRVIEHAFEACYSIRRIEGLANWDVSNVSWYYKVFYNCSSLEDLSFLASWNITITQTNPQAGIGAVDTFTGCSNVQRVGLADNYYSGILSSIPVIWDSTLFYEEGDDGTLTGESMSLRSLQSAVGRGKFPTTAEGGSVWRTTDYVFAGAVLTSANELIIYDATKLPSLGDYLDDGSKVVKVYPNAESDRTWNPEGTAWFREKGQVESVRVAGHVKAPDNICGWFYSMTNAETIDLTGLDTSGTRYMSWLFQVAGNTRYINVSTLDTHNVKNATSSFSGCYPSVLVVGEKFNDFSRLTIGGSVFDSTVYGQAWVNLDDPTMRFAADLSDWDPSVAAGGPVTLVWERLDGNYGPYPYAVLTTAGELRFYAPGDLPEVGDALSDGAIVKAVYDSICGHSSNPTANAWYADRLEIISARVMEPVSALSSMCGWFYGCTNMTSADLSLLDTSAVTNMYYLFCGNTYNLVDIDISSFDMSNVTNATYMFAGCFPQRLVVGAGCSFTSSMSLSITGPHYNGNVYSAQWVSANDPSVAFTASLTDWDGSAAADGPVTLVWKRLDGNYSGSTPVSLAPLSALSAGTSQGMTLASVLSASLDSVPAVLTLNDAAIETVDLDADQEEPVATDFAVLTEEGTLMLAHRTEIPSVGDTFEGEAVAYVYDGIANVSYYPRWHGERSQIRTVKVVDSPIVLTSRTDDGMYESMCHWFSYCSSLTTCDLSGLDTSSITSMTYIFYNCSSLTQLNLSGLNTSSLRYMDSTFYGCSSLRRIEGLEDWDVSHVSYFSNTFNGCSSLIDLSFLATWNVTVKTEAPIGGQGTPYMFYNCSSIKRIGLADDSYGTMLNSVPSSMLSTTFYREATDGTLTGESATLSELQDYIGTGVLPTIADGGSIWRTADYPTAGAVLTSNGELRIYNTTELPSYGEVLEDGSSVSYVYADASSRQNYPSPPWDNQRTLITSVRVIGSVIAPENMCGWFLGCMNVESINLSGLDTSRSTNMDYLFAPCSATYINVSTLDTSSNTSAWCIFSGSYPKILVVGEKYNLFTYLKIGGNDFNASINRQAWVNADNHSQEFLQDLSDWDPSVAADGPVTLIWARRTHTVSFDANQGTGSLTAMTPEQGIPYTLPSGDDLFRYDHVFTGWNTEPDGTGNTYMAGDEVTDLAEADESITLYAQWQRHEHAGDSEDGVLTFTLHANEAATFQLPAGTAYTVWEETNAGWVQVSSSGATGVIEPLETSVASFTNTYDPGTAQATIVGQKLLDGSPAAGFEVQLVDEQGDVVDAVTTDASGGVAFGPIDYTQAGDYLYTVSEVQGDDPSIDYDDAQLSVLVRVTDIGGALEAEVVSGNRFTVQNRTKTGSIELQKLVTGTDADDVEFSFEVAYGSTVVPVMLRAGETQTVDGVPYGSTYTVAETDVPAGYAVESIENATGTVDDEAPVVQVIATNSYSASGSFSVSATKLMEGRDLAAGDFRFLLADPEGTVVSEGTNDANGNVTFEPVELDAPGVYQYTVSEADGDDPSVSYDSSSHAVTVTAADNGDGTLSCDVAYGTEDGSAPTFSNSVKDGTLEVTKTVDGVGAPKAKAFTFSVALTGHDGEPWQGSTVGTISGADEEATQVEVFDGSTFRLMDGQTMTAEVPEGVSYVVNEEPSDGFETASSGTQGTIIAGETATASFMNTWVGTLFSVELAKVDSTDDHAGLPGAVFEVYTTTYKGASEAVAGGFDEASSQLVGTFESDDNGRVSLDGLSMGTYAVVETKAPGGYVCASAPWFFELGFEGGDETVTVQADSTTPYGWGEVDGTSVTVFLTNQRAVVLPTTGAGFLGLLGVGVAATATGLALKRHKKEDAD